MYRGFNLKLDEGDYSNYNLHNYENEKQAILSNLENYMQDGVINGKKLEGDWFPKIKADIFLSHSHENLELAKKLAGYLQSKFSLTTFIDSTVWEHANDLKTMLNHTHNRRTQECLEYHKVNSISSYVDMILSNALNKMIDRTECVFFLNTPESVFVDDEEQKTYSPWIFSELEFSKKVRINIPTRYNKESRIGTRFFSNIEDTAYASTEDLSESLKIELNADTSHFVDLDKNNLREWHIKEYLYQSSFPENHPLDRLYKQNPNK